MKKVFIVLLLLLFVSCSAPTDDHYGVSLSPQSFEGADFVHFFELSTETGDMVTWAGQWRSLEDKSSAPYVVAEFSRQYKYEPVIVLGLFSQETYQPFEPVSENSGRYVELAADFAVKYKPAYLGLGVEIDRIYAANPDGFEEFVQLFDHAYDAIKAVSPKTKVFTAWQLENIKGRHDGLFGKENGPARWELLERVPKSDLAVFTTYPGLIYKDPSEIPDDYYTEILQHTSKPIAFIEMGWPSSDAIPGWESSEEEQAAFIERFFEVKPTTEFVIWPFMHDPSFREPFGSMGLRKTDGISKRSWDSWKEKIS